MRLLIRFDVQQEGVRSVEDVINMLYDSFLEALKKPDAEFHFGDAGRVIYDKREVGSWEVLL